VLERTAIAALVRRAQRGDTGAFGPLVAAHLRAAYLTALAITGRPGDAEDVVQDAMLTAFERLDTCRDPARFPGWLLRIVRNRALNWLDQRRRREAPGGVAWDPDRGPPAQADPALRHRLLAALDLLSPIQREIVLLHDLEGWTHAEIADALDCSEVLSRQHLFVAHRAMRARLAPEDLKEAADG
jgi:RNA polymerase sigma-70 factor (ECF subfamily)